MTRRALHVFRAVAPALLAAGTGAPRAAAAQPAAPLAADALRLDALHAAALARDPRARQGALLAAQTALRLRTVDAERLPAVTAGAVAQWQSDVVTLPVRLPGGAALPLPPHDTYDATVTLRERLYDPTRGPRRAVERARLAESEARVGTALHALRQAVNDAYFGALRLEAQRAELAAGLADLDAQRRLVAARVRERAALPGEAALLDAERLRRAQALDELDAGRDAALTVLAALTGRAVADAAALPLPELGAAVARARAAGDDTRARPEHAQFARAREALDRQRRAVAAQELPRLSTFARAGYGRPGLNPLGREPDAYWLGGVQVEWAPWSWGATRREREALALQQRVVATEEAAFADAVRRGVAADLAAIDRLERALAVDDTIVALRARPLAEARLRLGEGVITAAEYVDRETDLLAARQARAAHRVELAQARARYLTALGLEVR